MNHTAERIEGPIEEAFVATYLAHRPAMVRLAYLLTGSSEAAEDVVHEVFLRVRSHLPLHDPAGDLRTSVVNASRSQHRRAFVARRHRPPAPLVMHRDLVDFRDALLALPRRRRTALVLRHFCGLDDAGIAEQLGCRLGAVRTLAHRGLADLRAAMGTTPAPPEVAVAGWLHRLADWAPAEPDFLVDADDRHGDIEVERAG